MFCRKCGISIPGNAKFCPSCGESVLNQNPANSVTNSAAPGVANSTTPSAAPSAAPGVANSTSPSAAPSTTPSVTNNAAHNPAPSAAQQRIPSTPPQASSSNLWQTGNMGSNIPRNRTVGSPAFGRAPQIANQFPAGRTRANTNTKQLIIKILSYLAAALFGIAGIVLLANMIINLGDAIFYLSINDALIALLGTIAYFLCGFILAGFALLGMDQILLSLLKTKSLSSKALNRALCLGIIVGLLCLAVWICSIFIQASFTSGITGLISYGLSVFASVAPACLVVVVVALALLFILRTEVVPKPSA